MFPRFTILAFLVAFSVLLPTAPAGAGEPGGAADRPQLKKLGPVLKMEILRQERLSRELASPGPFAVSGLLPTVSGPDGEERIPCWVRYDGSIRMPAGAMLGLQREGIATARLTIQQIEQLSRELNVVSIRAATHTYPLLDASVVDIGADLVHNASGSPPVYNGLSGAQIVVGIVDTGIDLDHEDFLDESGNTRLLYLWDQTVAGPNPPPDFGYGNQCTAAQIDAGSCSQTDVQGHGTHVAGIAAGDGSATGNGEPAWTYVGVAPEADLIVVKTDFLSTSVADGVDYIFRQAQTMGRKAVVNLSLGNHYGPHDGSSDLDTAIDALAGLDKLVVAAAGNEQDNAIHAEAVVAPGDSAVISFNIPFYASDSGANNDVVAIDGYYPATSAIDVKIVSPNGITAGPLSVGENYNSDTNDGAIMVDNTALGGEDFNIHVQVYDQVFWHVPAAGEWKIILYNNSKQMPSAVCDFWIYYNTLTSSLAFVEGLNMTKLVGSPATADSVIAVGSYVTKTQWININGQPVQYVGVTLDDISNFSSVGPRRDGVLKPNISAPGQGIGAALSTNWGGAQTNYKLHDGVHHINQGTSMAAPHVAGLAALMLASQAHYTCVDAIDKLQNTCRVDAFTGGAPNTTWGWGKIDAVAATSIPSPVLVYSVDAAWDGGGVLLSWEVPEELAALRFLVHRSDYGGPAAMIGETGTGPVYAFQDAGAPADGDPLYWLQPLDGGFGSGRIGPYRPAAGTTPVFEVSLPYPNPSGSLVRWRLRTPAGGTVRCEVLDPSGRRVWSEDVTVPAAGLHELEWDGRTLEGRPTAAGLYWIRTRFGDLEQVHKLLRVARGQD